MICRECVNLVDCLDYDRLRLIEPLRSLPQEYTDTGVGYKIEMIVRILESTYAADDIAEDWVEHSDLTFLLF